MFRADIPCTQGSTPGKTGLRAVKLGTPGGRTLRLLGNLPGGASISLADNPDSLNQPHDNNPLGGVFTLLGGDGLVQFDWSGEIYALSFQGDQNNFPLIVDLAE
jgi:hypothetical protein